MKPNASRFGLVCVCEIWFHSLQLRLLNAARKWVISTDNNNRETQSALQLKEKYTTRKYPFTNQWYLNKQMKQTN